MTKNVSNINVLTAFCFSGFANHFFPLHVVALLFAANNASKSLVIHCYSIISSIDTGSD